MPDYTKTMVRVNTHSTIRVCKRVYSVPSRLIGSRLRARLHETHIVLLDGMVVLAELPLRGGDRGAVIDFRHVINWLVRKPGAVGEYRWREAMFPSLTWRVVYDHLCRQHDAHEADVRYLEILESAADAGLAMVENQVEQFRQAPKAVVNAAAVIALLRTYGEEALSPSEDARPYRCPWRSVMGFWKEEGYEEGRPEATGVEMLLRGFHLPTMLSTVRSSTPSSWSSTAAAFLKLTPRQWKTMSEAASLLNVSHCLFETMMEQDLARQTGRQGRAVGDRQR